MSATKAGHVGRGVELWSGVGVPTQADFQIRLTRAKPEVAYLVMDGKPLKDCGRIKITDLEPAGLLGHVDYPVMTSDSEGRLSLERLTVGRNYGLIVQFDTGHRQSTFRWSPNVEILVR